MINAEILLRQGDKPQMGKVIGRTISPQGKTMVSYHENLILNSIIYYVEFPDGEVKEYAANILAENLLSQVDENGHLRLMLDSIVDYRKDPNKAVAIADKFVATRKGQQQLRKTTQGWDLLVRWRDGTES